MTEVHHSTDFGGGSFNPGDTTESILRLAAASTSYPTGTGLLKEPVLLNQDDFQHIKDFKRAQIPYRALYYEAEKLQRGHDEQWSALCREICATEIVAGDEATKIKDYMAKHDNTFQATRKKLAGINDKISKIKLPSGQQRTASFGQVETSPLRQPGLLVSRLFSEDNSDVELKNDLKVTSDAQAAQIDEWEVISANSEFSYAVAELFSQGYILQFFYNSGLEAPDIVIDEQLITDHIEVLNEKIGKIVEDLGISDNDEFAMLRIPEHDEIPLNGTSEYVPDNDDDPIPVSQELVVPDHIQKVRMRVGGCAGLLNKVLSDLDARFQIQSLSLRNEWQRHEELVRSLTIQAKITPNTQFQINLGQFAVHLSTIQDVLTTPNNLQKRDGYHKKREALLRSMLSDSKLPLNYLDAMLPPLSNLNGFVAAVTIPEEPTPEAKQRIEGVMHKSLIDSGVLARYTVSKMKKIEDPEVEALIAFALEEIEVAGGASHGHAFLASTKCEEHNIDDIIKQYKLRSALKEPDLQAFDAQLQNKMIHDILVTMDAIEKGRNTPHIPKRKDSHAGPKDSHTGLKDPHAGPEDPPARPKDSPTMAGYNLDDFQKVKSVLGSVFEEANGKEIEKKIDRVRRMLPRYNQHGEKSWSYQLLVKWKRDGFTKPSYEWIKGGKHKGAAELFEERNGKNAEWLSGSKDHLRNTKWSQMSVGGVTFAPRQENKVYLVNMPCHVLLHDELETNFKYMWFPISTLRTQYGEGNVNRERNRWCRSSGQSVPERVLTRAELHTQRRRRVVKIDEDEEDEGGGEDLRNSQNADDEEIDPPLTQEDRDFIDDGMQSKKAEHAQLLKRLAELNREMADKPL